MKAQNDSLFSNKLRVDDALQSQLHTIASWCTLIVVTSVTGYFFTIVQMMNSENQFHWAVNVFDGSSVLLRTVIAIGLGLFANICLFIFLRSVRTGLNAVQPQRLTAGFRNLQFYFAIMMIHVTLSAVLISASLFYQMKFYLHQ